MDRQRKTILDVSHLSISFTQYTKGLLQTTLPVIKDLSIVAHEGEVVAIVGSSGSGKSLLAHALLGVLPYNATVGGTITYREQELTKKRIAKLRGQEIVLVPQSVSYLDPLMQVGPQLRKGSNDPQRINQSRRILQRYGLETSTESLYPFELSGGMTRRILIATAVMEEPKLVIADEPTPGLHIDAAKRVMSHFREIADAGACVLLITHDLELALETADRIVVFYAGSTVEDARVTDFASEELLRHPYSKALYRAMPQNGFTSISGSQPYVTNVPNGCPFSPRCSMTDSRCLQEVPSRALRGGYVKCIHAI